MALVLAVGRLYTQKRASEELARQFAGHEIVAAALTADAFARMGARVPDLVVFPKSLFPSELAALAARLREWSTHQPDGALPIAVAPRPSGGGAHEEWFYWFRSKDAQQLVRGPKPAPTPPSAPKPVAVSTPVARAVALSPVEGPQTRAGLDSPMLDDESVNEPAPDAAEAAPHRRTASRVHDVSAALAGRAKRLGVAAGSSAARARVVAGAIAVRARALGLGAGKGLARAASAALRGSRQVASTAWHAAKRISSAAASRVSGVEMPSEESRRRALRFAGLAVAAVAAIGGITVVVKQAGSITSAATIRKPPVEPVAERRPSAAVAATNKGRLNVVSEPPGATVLVDGKPRGVTPVLVDDLTIGQHTVTLNGEAGSVTQSVKVKGNEIATLDVPIFTGWVALFAPFELQIIDGDRLISLDEQNRAMLPPGKHELQLVNRTLGYRSSQTIVVRPGEVTAASIVPPKAPSSLTSNPPAEVWLDGTRIGDTPLENVGVPIGTREFVFKNADYGERRVIETVTVKPFRLHVDFTKPGA